jgi:hypothetical protein
MAGRFARSFQLVKESLNVLKQDKEILLFPIISGVLSIILFVSFIIPFFLVKITEAGTIVNVGAALLIFAYYLTSYFIVIFFNVGLITCAKMRLNGQDPTFKDGMKNAIKHFFPILIWALISATVGLILRILADKAGSIGRFVIAIIGMAWNLLTIFVIPVMIFEDYGPFAAIKKSSSLFKKTWGEHFIGQATVGLFFLLLALIAVVPLLLVIFVVPSIYTIGIVVIITILYWLTLGIISSTLNGIYMTALYEYANTGKVPKAFTQDLVTEAFKPKKGLQKLA